ncbi:MAG: reverse transcriptase domain-containing protein [Bacteroidota bacterium]
MDKAYNLFNQMVTIENMLRAWRQFRKGKQRRKDIQYFERYLEDFIFQLHQDLITLNYQHGPYQHFYVFDPQKRYISKACVRDRLVHQMLYTTLSTIFDKTFFYHSFSCRIGKGTHAGVRQLHKSIRQVSRNGTQACFALKMDIQRFFDSVDHIILKECLRKRVQDRRVLYIADCIIDSFTSQSDQERNIGLPLGNVTSQLFANVYLHALDCYVKHTLRQAYYLRYCDDFIIVAHDKAQLIAVIEPIRSFLAKTLRLTLHPKKIILSNMRQGIDFLGYILFPHHQLLRTRTKRRMKRRLKEKYAAYLQQKIDATHMDQCLQSYLGILSHANAYELTQSLKNAYWVREPVD